MRKSIKYSITVVVVILIGLAAYFSFFHNSQKEAGNKTVTVGIINGSKKDDELYESVAKTAKDKYGIHVVYKKFTDYSQPNKALTEHEVDLNSFQHVAFLDAWNKAHHTDIVPIGKTIIGQGRIYSQQVKNVKDIKPGSTITIPNDPTNESRGLYILQSAGLIKLAPNKSLATVKDITSNPKNLNIKEVDASQTARSLPDVAASYVNGNFAANAGLDPNKAIYVEPVNKVSAKWINVIAANKADKNNKLYKEYVNAYQTQTTKDLNKKLYGKTQITAWDIKLK
ncbi:MetQ/NlpA family ABC transporter substrate-binding protein [Fructilactobacillus sanfranciscensis]|uniref:MetQ/NlpA family ABC transporter substrate-binding protein n=1 Tax=Fructilactobacillus sanfranciscensis TaxID=1625 RepID=UPI000CD47BC4|nr:MetQ/NlpA family ABC transporter substrate-binding protein [Fructilactobacillus sanfranciscensis]NDR69890.1 MetQ/NlpA family ABC transporter substrate-binding protein [Fructilactobacillus sanfranciscensis]NDS16628.1 MetQ/NlpA family ABC transporter substrate-binding protein [Fructilactobacillus sanfranciscensis]POH19698.1 ABC transporter substrate-binding protein [Fructilactobacillus sanfranciscensis]